MEEEHQAQESTLDDLYVLFYTGMTDIHEWIHLGLLMMRLQKHHFHVLTFT